MSSEKAAVASDPSPFAVLRDAAGRPADELAQMIEAIYGDGVLDTKTRELVFLGIQTAMRLHDAVRIHVARAIRAGATRKEVLAVMMTTIPNAGMNGAIECWPIAEREFEKHGA